MGGCHKHLRHAANCPTKDPEVAQMRLPVGIKACMDLCIWFDADDSSRVVGGLRQDARGGPVSSTVFEYRMPRAYEGTRHCPHIRLNAAYRGTNEGSTRVVASRVPGAPLAVTRPFARWWRQCDGLEVRRGVVRLPENMLCLARVAARKVAHIVYPCDPTRAGRGLFETGGRRWCTMCWYMYTSARGN